MEFHKFNNTTNESYTQILQKHSSSSLVWPGLMAVGPCIYIFAESSQTIINIVLKPTKLEKLCPIQMNIQQCSQATQSHSIHHIVQ